MQIGVASAAGRPEQMPSTAVGATVSRAATPEVVATQLEPSVALTTTRLGSPWVRLIVSIERATGTPFDAVRREWSRSAAVYHYTDLAWLWEVGVHPDEVDRIHAGLGMTEAMAPIAYLYVASSGAPLDELAPYAADGADAVCWAASSWLQHRGVTPAERREWFLTGLHWRLITALIGGPYALSDVRLVATATGSSLNHAGEVLAGWLAADCSPSVAEVVQVCRAVPHGRQTASTGALDVVLRSTLGSKLTRTEAALILAVAGTPTSATAMIRRGVRTLDGAVDDLAQLRRTG